MARKSILTTFFTSQQDKDYSHRSLLLNVELDSLGHFSFDLFHSGKKVQDGKSRLIDRGALRADLKKYIDEISRVSKNPTDAAVRAIQSKVARFTDDFLPKNIADFLILNRTDYKYLVIDDDALSINIPYGILFFPDASVVECISAAGFFLSEYYTVVRSRKAIMSELSVSKMSVLCTDDLTGSLREQAEIVTHMNSIRPGVATIVNGKNHMDSVLQQERPNCLHFCCHGTATGEILIVKNGVPEYIPMDFFSLHRFPENTIVFLNICSSAYTKYEEEIARSIAGKFIDRNAQLVIMTEWPIFDACALIVGTEFYKNVNSNQTALQIIHKIKKDSRVTADKFTTMTYSLRGNPNMLVKVEAGPPSGTASS